MAELPDYSWLLTGMRGASAGPSLAREVSDLGEALNKARDKVNIEGGDDTARVVAMRQAWESFSWEVRYAHLATSFAQWFTITAQHNGDRVPLMPRVIAIDQLALISGTALLLALPELERAMNHEVGMHPEPHERAEGEACDCFNELLLRMKLEHFANLVGAPETTPGSRKGEA